MSEEKKFECGMIQDLLPLYQDEVCTESSKRAVEEHLAVCASCRALAEKLKNMVYEEELVQEKESVLAMHEKKERRRSRTIGFVTAGILMIPVIVCLICNLAIGHALDWFFIVLTSLLLTASLTVVPMLVREKRLLWTLGCGTASLLLLFLVICIYSGGTWFFVAATPVIFGLSVVFGPYVIKQIPMPKYMANRKGLSVMLWDTAWLFLLIFVCGFYSTTADYRRIAFGITAFSLLLPWVFFLVIRYARTNVWIKAGILTVFTGGFITAVDTVVDGILGLGYEPNFLQADLRKWDSVTADANVNLLILLTGIVIGIAFLAVGIGKRKSKKAKLVP